MLRNKKLTLTCVAAVLSAGALAPATAQAADLGDIAFVYYHSDDPDAFAFVALADIAVNDTIGFTDRGYTAADGLYVGEGAGTWTATEAVPAGTIVTLDIPGDSASTGTFTASGGFSLSTNGDSIIAFSGSINSPTIIAAIQGNGAWDADATNTNECSLPDALTDGVNAVAIVPEADNFVYDCSVVQGTASELLAAINDSSNWTSNNTGGALTAPDCAFVLEAGSGDGDGDGDGDTGTTGDGDGDGGTGTTGDGDGDGDTGSTGDGDGDTGSTGDGDGDTGSTGDGDGDTGGDGDGDTGGDGDTSGGDGDTSGGDGDTTGGDGDTGDTTGGDGDTGDTTGGDESTTGDSGGDSGTDTGTDTTATSDTGDTASADEGDGGGCNCSAENEGSGGAALALFGLLGLARRRRRR